MVDNLWWLLPRKLGPSVPVHGIDVNCQTAPFSSTQATTTTGRAQRGVDWSKDFITKAPHKLYPELIHVLIVSCFLENSQADITHHPWHTLTHA